MHLSGRCIERCKELIFGNYGAAGQCIKDGRFARVGVPDQTDEGDLGIKPLLALILSRISKLFKLPLQSEHKVFNMIDVELFLSFAGPTGTDSTTLLGHRAPLAGKTRFLMLKHRHLDLYLALCRYGPFFEDLKNQLCPVEDLGVYRFTDIPELFARESVRYDNLFDFVRFAKLGKFMELAFGKEVARIYLAELDKELMIKFDVIGFNQVYELLDISLDIFSRIIGRLDAYDEGPGPRYSLSCLWFCHRFTVVYLKWAPASFEPAGTMVDLILLEILCRIAFFVNRARFQ